MPKILQTARGPVEYEDSGAGEALLVFHGSPGGWDGALLCAELHLGTGFRVLGFSRPGYLGTPLDHNGSVEAQADLAAALLDELHIPAATVYGLSGGGPYSLAFAIRHPEKCRRLVLGAAVTKLDPRPEWQLSTEVFLLRLLDLVAWIPVAIAPKWQWSRILSVISPAARRAAGYRNDIRVFNTLPVLAVERIRCPVLAVHGRNDRNASFPHAKETAARIPGCKTVFVEGAGHIDVFEHQITRDAIQSFLSASLLSA